MSWQAFVEEHGEAVFRIAFRVLRNAHDAEDVCQQVLLEAHRMPLTPDMGLLRRMAAFRAIDSLRKRTNAIPFDEEKCFHPALPADEAAEKAEQAELLRSAIARLPPQQARCFWLRYVEGLSNQEIAETERISLSSVSTALNKARQRLRRSLSCEREKLDE